MQKRGTGTLVLMNSNSYRGGTSVDAGTLRAGSSGAFGGGSMSLSNAAGAILDLDGFDTSVTSLSGGGALGGNVALGGATLTISSGNSNGTSYTGAITGIGNFVKNGNGTQRLTGCASSYSGSTTINGGVLEVSCLADGGSVSSIGMSSANADNLVINGGVLRYTGSGDSTDRQFTLGASGGNSIESEGTGAILFTSNAAVTFAAANTAQTLTLAGTNTDDNEFGAQLTNNGSGVTSLTKSGAGTWFLTNSDSTYTGVTKIDGGILGVDKLANGGLASSIGASSSAASNLIIGNGSTLRYLGTGDTTDRLFTLASGVTYIESSGSGAIVFTDTGQVTLADNNQARTIALGGMNTGDNTLAGSIGDAGTGKTTLAKNDGGTWVLTGNNTFTGLTVVNKGLLKIGNGGTTGSLTSDIVVADGGLIFNRSDTLNYGGLISGAGFVTQSGSGTTILTGANSYTGATSVSAGTLLVNGDQSAATGQTSVANGGILGGSGIIGGNVVVTDGALAPGSNGAGTLTINGSLALSAGSILSMQLGQAGVAGGALNDLIEVKGNLTLDGTLDVAETAGGSYGPGIYRLINYTGSLTDNGLDIGMLPNGAGAIQTAVAGQVNLLAGGTNFNFWDGDAGPKFNSAVDGGNGTWQNSSGNNNWTDATGNINASYSDGAFAIFTGTAGTITIDNSLGQVKAEGMQFAIDGYAVTGEKLELTGPQSTIRVGDGTTAGAAYIATINSVLTGNTQLEKTDAGTLVLTGANSYTGGTAINGGTIRISSDDNLGVASSDISFDGGALNTTANIATDRAIILTGAGTLLTDASTTLSLSGPISGTGALTKSGTGTLLLSGTAAHTGGTTITAGTLQIGNGGTDGSIDGNIVNNGALVFDRAGTLAYTGSISGTGTLTKNGSSTLTMTGTSTYTGETTVSAGTLALQAGGQIKGTASLTVDGGAEVLIDGSGSQFATGAGASVVGTGTVTVRDGGTASFDSLTASNATGTNSTITVAGSGSQMT
nr:autotransporter-associated beta strand repeat-containing protein [Brucella sp. 83/13]